MATGGLGGATCVTVVVIGSVRMYREGISASLAARAGVEVVGSGATATEVRQLITANKPAVVVIDVATAGSFEIIQCIRMQAPWVRIVAFGLEDSEVDILACAEAGVHGYVARDASIDDLGLAIGRAARGELLCSQRITASLFRRLAALAGPRDVMSAGSISLTAREREILTLLDGGLSNKEIGNELHIEISTVKNHVHRVLEKLNVGSRSAAAARLRVGLPSSAHKELQY